MVYYQTETPPRSLANDLPQQHRSGQSSLVPLVLFGVNIIYYDDGNRNNTVSISISANDFRDGVRSYNNNIMVAILYTIAHNINTIYTRL